MQRTQSTHLKSSTDAGNLGNVDPLVRDVTGVKEEGTESIPLLLPESLFLSVVVVVKWGALLNVAPRRRQQLHGFTMYIYSSSFITVLAGSQESQPPLSNWDLPLADAGKA